MRRVTHADQDVVAGIDRIENQLLAQRGEAFRDDALRRADLYVAQDAGGEAAAGVGCLDMDGMTGTWLHGGQRRIERRESEAVYGCRLTCDAIVVHRVHAVGGDIGFEKRAANRRGDLEDAFDSNSAKREVVGELAIRSGKGG